MAVSTVHHKRAASHEENQALERSEHTCGEEEENSTASSRCLSAETRAHCSNKITTTSESGTCGSLAAPAPRGTPLDQATAARHSAESGVRRTAGDADAGGDPVVPPQGIRKAVNCIVGRPLVGRPVDGVPGDQVHVAHQVVPPQQRPQLRRLCFAVSRGFRVSTEADTLAARHRAEHRHRRCRTM